MPITVSKLIKLTINCKTHPSLLGVMVNVKIFVFKRYVKGSCQAYITDWSPPPYT